MVLRVLRNSEAPFFLSLLISAVIFSCAKNEDAEKGFTNLEEKVEPALIEQPLPPGQERTLSAVDERVLEKYSPEVFGAIYEPGGAHDNCNNLDSVAHSDYVWLVDPNFINKEQISGKSYEVERFTTYLGMLYDLRDSTGYHVLKQFWTLQCAISKRGHSDVIFLGEKEKTCRIYELDMPDELPAKIENNALVFGKTGIKLNGGLPLMLCDPNGGCHE